MKKLLLTIFVLVLLLVAGIYIFIPAKLEFGKAIYIHANRNITSRYIADQAKWVKWWPADNPDILATKENEESTYTFKNYHYTIVREALGGTSILIKYNGKKINSFLHLIALKPDSVVAEWKGELKETNNPVARLNNYFLALRVKENISEILQNVKTFLENNERAYGLKIIQQQVKDTILIATKFTANKYPSAADIYNIVTGLRGYISSNGATETNPPMLNVTRDSIYNIMVAIPVNKVIPATGKFVLKRMVPGKILVTEVKGGDYTAAEALRQLTLYMEDNQLTAPAIPFQSLVTERTKEPDTTKWITRIYYPVI